MKVKEIMMQKIESNIETYMELVRTMYDNPEIGNEEFETMKLLVDYLDKVGFKTTSGYVVPTGFLGEYDTGKEGRQLRLCVSMMRYQKWVMVVGII